MASKGVDMHQGSQVDHKGRDGSRHTAVQPQNVGVSLQLCTNISTHVQMCAECSWVFTIV